MFWLVFFEVVRVLKPGGIFYLNAPAAGDFHRYPVDCWRFYPNSGGALIKWAERNGINAALLESYTHKGGDWQDYIAVFLQEESLAGKFPKRILDRKVDFENGQLLSTEEILKYSGICQYKKSCLQ